MPAPLKNHPAPRGQELISNDESFSFAVFPFGNLFCFSCNFDFTKAFYAFRLNAGEGGTEFDEVILGVSGGLSFLLLIHFSIPKRMRKVTTTFTK